jgi:Vitamin K-dependent gamma-carboxylase
VIVAHWGSPRSELPAINQPARWPAETRRRPMDDARVGSRWKSGFIAAYLLLQVLLPLRYYLRDDTFDERFAWRMFSPERMVECKVEITQQSRGVRSVVQPRRELAEAWVGLMERARGAVIDAYAAHRCAQLAATDAAPAVYVSLSCAHPAGVLTGGFDPQRNLCEAP